jgi:hypothetical protein
MVRNPKSEIRNPHSGSLSQMGATFTIARLRQGASHAIPLLLGSVRSAVTEASTKHRACHAVPSLSKVNTGLLGRPWRPSVARTAWSLEWSIEASASVPGMTT